MNKEEHIQGESFRKVKVINKKTGAKGDAWVLLNYDGTDCKLAIVCTPDGYVNYEEFIKRFGEQPNEND